MAFDFASAISHVRRVVHDTLAVEATYTDASVSDPAAIRVRWATKMLLAGDLEGSGYAEMLQGVDRIVLIPSDTPTITFRKGGVVTLTATQFDGIAFKLDLKEESNGPLEEVWKVTRA